MAARGIFALPGFARLWTASSVTWFGSFASALALQLLIIETLQADQAALGLVRSAQWLPALVFGLVAGVLVDRVRRRPVLVLTDAISAVLFGLIGGLAVAGVLSVPLLACLVFGVGTASVFFHAAHQSFVPRLVPERDLPVANARIDQSMTAAESIGPLVTGALVRALTAPAAVLMSAVSHAVSALLYRSIRITEAVPERSPDRHVWHELHEGARWVYRHRTLAPYALSLHLWFLGNSTIQTVLVFYLVRGLGVGPVAVGVVLAVAGVSGVLGAGLAPRLAVRFGLGRVCIVGDWLTAAAFGLVLAAPDGGPGGLALLCLAQLVFGLGGGLKGPLEGSYRNAVTPDRLRARMNATIRSFNRGVIVVSAPLAGWAASVWGDRPVILTGLVILAAAALILTLSPFRQARMPGEQPVGG